MKRLIFALLAVIAIVGCGKDGGEGNQNSIILTGGTKTNQTVYADQTSNTGGSIKFKASSSWRATVTASAVRSTEHNTDWLNLAS